MSLRARDWILEGLVFTTLGAVTGGAIGLAAALPSGFAIWIAFLGIQIGLTASAAAYVVTALVFEAGRRLPQGSRIVGAAVAGGTAVALVAVVAGSILGSPDRWLIFLVTLVSSAAGLAGLLALRERVRSSKLVGREGVAGTG